MDRERLANLVLRAGAAFAFLYPPYAAFFDPVSWLGYFPPFVLNLSRGLGIPDLVVLHGFGALEVLLALWVLSGKKIFYPCVIMTAILLSIVALDWGNFSVLFRDLSIAALTFGLALMHKKEA
jgi:hypothetical protein